jgi:hypothetical protein
VIAVGDQTVGDMAGVAGITNAVIVADSAAFSDNLDDELTTKVLPRYQGGMRDINAVVSSAFVLGEAFIEGFRTRDVAKHESELRLTAATKNADIELQEGSANLTKDIEVAKMNISKDVAVENVIVTATEQLVRIFLTDINWSENYARMVVEANRIKIVAKSEENQLEIDIDKGDALWDLSVLKYGNNTLASIGSASVSEGVDGPSQMQSAVGGAMAGAGAGAMVGTAFGNPIAGAVIGGVIGAGLSFL